MNVYTRLDLARRDSRHGDEPRLLLEGSWPQGSGATENSLALDDVIDSQYAWIDQTATELAEQIAGRGASGAPSAEASDGVTFAWLGVLKLRYFLVKLLRVIALVDAQAWSNQHDTIRLNAEPGRDDVYVDLLRSICRSHGIELRVNESVAAATTLPPQPPPPNGAMRQAAGAVSSWLDRLRREVVDVPRVVFVGDQAVLGDVCAESLGRGHRGWWLFDRFCLSAWRQWSAAGAGQLTCNSSRGHLIRRGRADLDLHAQSWPWYARGVDLTPAVHRWLREQAAVGAGTAACTTAARQTRLVQRIDRHFVRLRPTHVVLDEDATPLARAAVAMARRHGATTSVVQHGAPFVRFGFVPSVADQTFVWGESSKRQLVDWGAAAETIHVTGSPKHDRRSRRNRAAPATDRRREVLLLTTVPPRDDRPDAVSFHLTGATHEKILRAAFAAVARLDGYELIVRPHPRADETSLFEQIAAETAGLRYRIERDEPLADAVSRVAVVLSCASSAGVDAVRLGARVVQLMPEGSTDALVAEYWGMLGTARSLDELTPLLVEALDPDSEVSDAACANVFVNRAEPAAWRIVDRIGGAVIGGLENGGLDNGGAAAERITIRFDAPHAGPARKHDPRPPGAADERRAA